MTIKTATQPATEHPVKASEPRSGLEEIHNGLASTNPTLVNVQQLVEEYLDRSDWRVNANANQGYSLGGLILNMAGNITANYWLNHIYDPDIGLAHREGDVHIHDLDMLSGYCAGWSLCIL